MGGINILIGGNEDQIHQMNDALSHRGVATTAQQVLEHAWFGHVRAPVQDPSEHFDQPVTQGDLSIVTCGNVFNLRDLGFKNVRLDAIPILSAYKRKSATAFRDFDGAWSLALADRSSNAIAAVTDGIAQRPLYTRTHKEFFALSSEIRPLLELAPVTWDREYLSAVMRWGFCPVPGLTAFDEIRSILPFYTTIISGIKQDHCRLTSVPYDRFRAKSGIDLRSVIEKAVKNCLKADVPVALLLSGGLNSTIIFEVAKRITHNFTVLHVENECSSFLGDLDFPSDIKVKILKTQPTSFKDAVEANQSPVDVGPTVQQRFQLGQAIQDAGFNVVLSGDGADVLFGGTEDSACYDKQRSDLMHNTISVDCPMYDRLMAASKVQLRCPFLSKKVIESALSLDYSVRSNRQQLKFLFMDMLPKKVMKRKKHGLQESIPHAPTYDDMSHRTLVMRVFIEQFSKYVDDTQSLQMVL